MMSLCRRFVWMMLVVGGLGVCAASARADFVPGASLVDPGLPGAVETDVWTAVGLSSAVNPGFGNFPGLGPWPGPIGSDQGGDAGLVKLGNGVGGAFPIGSGVYFGGVSSDPNTEAATLAVQDSTAVAGLANVVFQIQIGEALGYDFFDRALPVLSYNGGSQNLAATLWEVTDQYDNGTFDSPAGPQTIYINTYLLQWDLSGIAGVTDFSISFTGVEHAQLYSMRLDQSDVFAPYNAPVAVPEPASLAMLGCGLAALFVGLRKRS